MTVIVDKFKQPESRFVEGKIRCRQGMRRAGPLFQLGSHQTYLLGGQAVFPEDALRRGGHWIEVLFPAFAGIDLTGIRIGPTVDIALEPQQKPMNVPQDRL